MSLSVSELKSKVKGRKIEDITVATLEDEVGEAHTSITIKLDNGDIIYLRSYIKGERNSFIDIRFREHASKRLYSVAYPK